MNIRSIFSYLIYFIVAIVLSYYMQWITVLFVGSMRFTAADSYPGDLSSSSLIILSVAFSLIHFVVLSVILLIQNFLMSLLKINFLKRIPLILNIIITFCLIVYFLNIFLD